MQVKKAQFSKHIHGNDTIGNMVSMATLNASESFTNNNADTKGFTKISAVPPYGEPSCVTELQIVQP